MEFKKMEFNKNNTKVPNPFWLFCIEIENITGRNIEIIKSLTLVSDLWKDRLVNGTYKVMVKDIKNDLNNLSDNESAYYEVGITLKQLRHDEAVKDGIEKILDFFDEHFIKD